MFWVIYFHRRRANLCRYIKFLCQVVSCLTTNRRKTPSCIHTFLGWFIQAETRKLAQKIVFIFLCFSVSIHPWLLAMLTRASLTRLWFMKVAVALCPSSHSDQMTFLIDNSRNGLKTTILFTLTGCVFSLVDNFLLFSLFWCQFGRSGVKT